MVEIRETPAYAAWFAALRDRTARARIDIRIRRLSLGNSGDIRPVGDGVSELRIHYGPGYRIYLTKQGDAVVIFARRRRQEFPRHGYSSRQRLCSKSLGESNDQNHYDNLGPSHTPCHG